MKFVTYRDSVGYWRWHLKAANGRVIASSSEGYQNLADCNHAIAHFKASALHAPIQASAAYAQA